MCVCLFGFVVGFKCLPAKTECNKLNREKKKKKRNETNSICCLPFVAAWRRRKKWAFFFLHSKYLCANHKFIMDIGFKNLIFI